MTTSTPVGSPPAPATSSPMGTRTGTVLGPLGGASSAATGGACAPPGNVNPTTPASGVTQGGTTGGVGNASPPGHGNQAPPTTGGNHRHPMPGWLKALIWLLLAILLLALVGAMSGGCGALGMWGWGKLFPDTPPTPPPPVTVVIPTPPPPPAPPPPNPKELQPTDVADFCEHTSRALGWFFVAPDTGTEGTMVVRACHNPGWAAKPDRRVTRDGQILRLSEGEGSSSTIVSGNSIPGGSGWETLFAKFGKSVLVGNYKGQPIELGPDTLLVHLPPATQNPTVVYNGECEDLAKDHKPPEDRWLREIWTRCRLGGQRNTSVAVSMAKTCSVSGCFAREDGAALSARVRAVEGQVKANGDRPVQPVYSGYDHGQPR